MKIHVGCCGWGFFRPKVFFGKNWKEQFKSVLQAYASLFSLVEVNSTFYRLPKLATATKWFKEAKEKNKKFRFTVKCSKIVTHEDKFSSKRSVDAFESILEISKALKSDIILIQTPASFKAEEYNIKNLVNFLSRFRKQAINIAWEPRGKSWKEEIVKEICKKANIIHCVDPFRNSPQYFSTKKIAYFRLHGLGKPTMYNYKFSKNELTKLKKIISNLNAKEVYVLFNNIFMYENALEFKEIV